MSEETLFKLPTSPEEFSVLLPPSELRKIDFSALEFATARRATVEYIKTYFPNDFNDFVSNNGIIMLLELISYLTGVLSLRGDMQGNQGFLPTATDPEAVANHLVLIGQTIRRATPAVVDIECSVSSPVGSDVAISAAQKFTIKGSTGASIGYEVFRSPTDLAGDIVIPAGKRAVIAYGVQGVTDFTVSSSDGSAGQIITVNTSENILESPLKVEVILDSITTEWNQIDAIEKAGANDKVFEARIFSKRIEFIFGDNITGAIPQAGADIKCTYRLGGGAIGRIGVGVISETRPVTPNYPYTAPVTVLFRNVTPSSGGVDAETIDQAKSRAPRDFATHNSIVTGSDYAQLVGSYSHPVYGSIAKAAATVRTDINTNLVELYVLAIGPDQPIAANEGLKRAVQSYVDELNTLTDSVSVLDGKIKAVDLDLTVVMSRSADASVVKVNVEKAIADFFNIANWSMGQGLFTSKLQQAIGSVDGVKYVDLFAPANNILPTNDVNTAAGTEGGTGVDVNELLTLGNKEIRYYYEVR